jgi:hypothetical protein
MPYTRNSEILTPSTPRVNRGELSQLSQELVYL